MLDFPCQVVRHVNAPAARLDRRFHVGAQGIADHHRLGRAVAVAGEDIFVDRAGLGADDLDSVEEVAEPGLRQFALLVEQVALGDEQHAVAFGDLLDRLASMGEEFDRVLQHLLPGRDQFRDDAGGYLLVGHLDGGFDHRQGEALDPESVMAEVAPFRSQQPVVQVVAVGIVFQQSRESLLRQAEEAFVLPERIVRIEADCGQIPCHETPS